jgi:hypothetical protein
LIVLTGIAAEDRAAYFDNDVVHKLAACDLLEITLQVLGIQHGQAVVLPTAEFRFFLHKPQKGEAKYGAVVFGRIRDFINAARKLRDAPDSGDVALLGPVAKIDVGERILLSAASRDDGTVLTTGDKRALEALANAQSCESICARLSGRVLCFEQLLQLFTESAGFAQLLEHVVPGVTCDKVLEIVFSNGLQTKEEDAVAGLESYVQDLRGKTGTLLRPKP